MLKEGRGKKNRGEEEREDLEVAESSAGFGMGWEAILFSFQGPGVTGSKGVSKPLRLYNYFLKMYFSLPWCKFIADRDSVCFVHRCT